MLVWGLRVGALKKTKQGLSFERRVVCPAGTRAFFTCCLGRLRRGQGGAGYGAAPPSRPPLHPPRSTPLGLSPFQHSTRAARLLLRELPRCARRSPCAPRNASVRFRLEREAGRRLAGLSHCGAFGRYVCFIFGELQSERTAAHATHRSFCSFSDGAGIVTRAAS